MRNISKILMCLLIGASFASCTGSAYWVRNANQNTVNSYFEERVNNGRDDLEDLCDSVRKSEFDSAEDPASRFYASMARKKRKAFEFIAEKKGSDVECQKPTADEISAHLYSVSRRAARAASRRSSANSERLDALEAEQRRESYRRIMDWRIKGYPQQ